MFLSIIVPVFNVSQYIKECIDSLEKQTEKAFEVIFIEDCSTEVYEVDKRNLLAGLIVVGINRALERKDKDMAKSCLKVLITTLS